MPADCMPWSDFATRKYALRDLGRWDVAKSVMKSVQSVHGASPGFRNRYTVAEMKAGKVDSPWILTARIHFRDRR
jgi:hypothetical protein